MTSNNTTNTPVGDELPNEIVDAANAVDAAHERAIEAQNGYRRALAHLSNLAAPLRPASTVVLNRADEDGESVRIQALITDVRVVTANAADGRSLSALDRVAFACRGFALSDDGGMSGKEVKLTLTVREALKAKAPNPEVA